MTKIRWEETNKVDPMEEEKWEKLVEEVKALVKELTERYAEEDVPLFLRIPKRLIRSSIESNISNATDDHHEKPTNTA